MALTLMYITNRPEVARIADASGVDWVFVDLEILGKRARQGHLDTVMSGHTVDDVRAVRTVLRESKLLVRVNPIHVDSCREIHDVISAGADIVMLPYFHHHHEVAEFVNLVNGRAAVCLLVETPEATVELADILALGGIDFVHIGLNDLHIGYELPFMFDLLADGTVEELSRKIRHAGIPFGFGGVARLGVGDLPAEKLVAEHVRLGSSMAILSRSFYRPDDEPDLGQLKTVFRREVARIRVLEAQLADKSHAFFEANRLDVVRSINEISRRRAMTSATKASSSRRPSATVGTVVSP